jgi:hypothetical protein
MIRQLHRLLHPVGPGPNAPLALAVYAKRTAGGWTHVPATAQGFEGVACVDDAARAAVLFCGMWQATGAAWTRRIAERLLRFIAAMQDDSGRFANFILDWDGRPNLAGPTSAPGGLPWAARALHAFGCGAAALGAPELLMPVRRGLACIDVAATPLDLVALVALAAFESADAAGDRALRSYAVRCSEQIADHRIGGLLPDIPGRTEVHLWGHLQEAALARIGARSGRLDIVDVAAVSAQLLLIPAARSGFRAPSTCPFDVASVITGLDAVGQVTGDAAFLEHGQHARDWFAGRNPAGLPVYNRRGGFVHDGVDGDRLNPDSGAEANVEGALAFLPAIAPTPRICA